MQESNLHLKTLLSNRESQSDKAEALMLNLIDFEHDILRSRLI